MCMCLILAKNGRALHRCQSQPELLSDQHLPRVELEGLKVLAQIRHCEDLQKACVGLLEEGIEEQEMEGDGTRQRQRKRTIKKV